MLFNSIEFLVFFPVVTALYFLLPHRLRWAHLLVASCVFYMGFIPAYILILGFTIVVDYFAGILIEGAWGRRRKAYLLMSIVANVGVLAVFKYYNFLNRAAADLAGLLGVGYAVPFLALALPIGLSFHTFQAMSYTIEVYRSRQRAERHFGIYSLYVMFYPQLVAGPIERPQNLLRQFYERHEFEYERVTNGLKLMLWGMFKKVVIADRLAVYVDAVYNAPQEWGGQTLAVATVFFAFQIYCDFSGYSDIAIGAAQVMGFRLMTNFNRPYHAQSVSEFWKRWHISLSTWFRDYLYLPLGGSRVPKRRWYFNLFFTFLVSGIWHGANWTFVAWGALNGSYLLCSIWTRGLRARLVKFVGLDARPALHRAFKIVFTFGLTCYAWIFFRANSIADAVYINRAIASAALDPLRGAGAVLAPMPRSETALALFFIAFMELMHLVQRKRGMRAMLAERPAWFRWAVYYALTAAILLAGQFGGRQFIYFQF
ncbi:MAG: MBOAT family protein [Acidobacteriota bacterium]|nr:MBOAT family protein [Acidobacteriota bacterium]